MSDDPVMDGREAERLLTDPILRKVFGQLEATYVAQWKMADTPAKREQFHACVKAIGDIRGQLEAMKSNKAMAEARDKTFGHKR